MLECIFSFTLIDVKNPFKEPSVKDPCSTIFNQVWVRIRGVVLVGAVRRDDEMSNRMHAELSTKIIKMLFSFV